MAARSPAIPPPTIRCSVSRMNQKPRRSTQKTLKLAEQSCSARSVVSAGVVAISYPNTHTHMDPARIDVTTPSRAYTVAIENTLIDRLGQILEEVRAPERR